MGMKKLADIAHTYIEKGYGDTPAAIIRYASLPYHKLAQGMVKNLVQLAAEKQITHPALIIIGRVANSDLLVQEE
jgi:uroporphyrin-III C-methyltransferase